LKISSILNHPFKDNIVL